MSNIWFTSDTHFGHKNIVKAVSEWPDKEKACRDFASVEDHDNYLLEQINKRVKPTDKLIHLGDFGLGFAWRERLPELRAKIKCETIELVLGNHDHLIEESYSYFKNYRLDMAYNGEDVLMVREPGKYKKFLNARKIVNLFSRIDYLRFGKIGGHPLVLCHYAMRTFPWHGQGSWMLYGHSHSNLPDDPTSLSIDIGVDTCLFGHEKYTPYEFSEIKHIMESYKKLVVQDHHSSRS